MVQSTKEKTNSTPLGIQLRGKNIRILFYYQGIQCFETVATGTAKAEINYAVRRRAEVLRKIEDGEFDYRVEFPNSNNIKKFHHSYNFTCGDLLLKQITIYEKMALVSQIKPITVTTYKNFIINKLLPAFKDTLLNDLTPQEIKGFILSLNCSSKAVSQIIIPLRAMLDGAVNDGLITYNPLNGLALNKLIRENFCKSDNIRDRYTDQEREAIIAACHTPMLKWMITFEFFAGCRIGELIALRWVDVFEDYVSIIHNQVKGITGTPKSESGLREVLLLPRAKEALIEMRKLTGQFEHVFISQQTKRPWQSSDALQKQWVKILQRAGVKYRNPYLMRHTYAHMLLDRGETLQFVADQLGHRDMEMVIKVYGGTTKRTNYKLKGEY